MYTHKICGTIEYMKKIIIGILFIVVVVLVLQHLGPFGFKNPKDYGECILTGGKTNENETRSFNMCRYNFKNYTQQFRLPLGY